MAGINIGIAGYMGSGKSTCAGFFSQYDATVINADTVAKEMMDSETAIRKRLRKLFGDTIFNNNTIDYTTLGVFAFESLDTLRQLNAIVHPPLLERLQSICTDSNDALCVCDAALISYWGIEDWFDTLLWVHASRDIRLKRLQRKGTLSTDELVKRIDLQETLFKEPEKGPWIRLLNESTPENFVGEIKTKSTLNFSSYPFKEG